MKNEKKDCVIHVRVTPSLRKQLDVAAEKDGVTLSFFIADVLKRYLEPSDSRYVTQEEMKEYVAMELSKRGLDVSQM